jgi:ABC-type thiamin/hydroxymethylpyrimidine transport system permease subunit
MQVARAQQPIAAAAVTLVTWALCIAAFLPPLSQYTLQSVPLMVLAGMGIAVSLILHLVFIGMAAKRLDRSVAGWVVVALCGLPIASIVGLILFEWFSDEQNQSPA